MTEITAPRSTARRAAAVVIMFVPLAAVLGSFALWRNQLPPELAAQARGLSLDPTNSPILETYGDNALRYRMRAHPNVAQIHHDDLIQGPRGAI